LHSVGFKTICITSTRAGIAQSV